MRITSAKFWFSRRSLGHVLLFLGSSICGACAQTFCVLFVSEYDKLLAGTEQRLSVTDTHASHGSFSVDIYAARLLPTCSRT